jgi:hypothetical protein
VYGAYTEPIYAKTPENPPRCHVPLTYDCIHEGNTEEEINGYVVLSKDTDQLDICTAGFWTDI